MNKKDNKPLNEDIDALVDYIDNFMSKSNAGHMNIKVNNGHINKEELYIDNSGNCQNCYKVPNLFDGLDDKNKESED